VAKEFLSRHDVAFTEKNVSLDRAAGVELAQLGSQGVPTLVVDDQVIIGFDQNRLSTLLHL
jgi:glutaredoxin